ncbi:hypothetical protein [Paenibacillus physcomitrellae]|uniref:Preprotein translocase subunit Tim44 n=1 Tax=Paenibacillus physcomitrellae TaxID=1619311 RepID=A0ABQ1FLU5_9BACL|nr:hypothetical protein [Paenibacillus physcomitrellae]GGA20352.1 hypothetical protein GCM10010917_01240 [Paenibacillus physcomitrellae]
MLKKIVMVVMAFTLFFAFTIQDNVDAKGRIGGGYKSGVKSHTTTPNKSTTTDNVSKSGTTSSTKGTAGTTANRGFFSGGSFMKGLMIGGLSGLLFGSLFAGMGGFGNLLGLAVNIFAIYLIIVIAAALFRRFTRPRKPDPRDGRY